MIGTATSVTIRPAGFWLRVLATLVDSMILSVALSIIALILGGATGIAYADQVSSQVPFNETLAILALVGTWSYFVLMESSERKASLGKLVLGLRVVNAHGERLSVAQAVLRFSGKFVNLLTLGGGFVLCGLSADKQGLHDLLADTYVVRVH